MELLCIHGPYRAVGGIAHPGSTGGFLEQGSSCSVLLSPFPRLAADSDLLELSAQMDG